VRENIAETFYKENLIGSKMDNVREKTRSDLKVFSQKWSDYKENEAQGAQLFLTEFCHCFGVELRPDNFEKRIKIDDGTKSGRIDCMIPDIVLLR
jgi:hypothetical protein